MSDTCVTVWFVTAADPVAAITATRHADRGFGRKYLAMLKTTWPVTPIGEFTFNGSADASPGEFYIGAFPGVTLVHTCLPDITSARTIPTWLRDSIPAADTFIIAWRRSDGFGSFAHYTGSTLRRAFTALPDTLIEDTGLPAPFEAPYWAGEKPNPHTGSRIALPFAPIDLAHAAEHAYVGVDVHSPHPAVHVAAFATDGRKEPKVARTRPTDIASLARTTSTKLGLNPERDYDDYENYTGDPLDTVQERLSNATAGLKNHARRIANKAADTVDNAVTATRRALGKADPNTAPTTILHQGDTRGGQARTTPPSKPTPKTAQSHTTTTPGEHTPTPPPTTDPHPTAGPAQPQQDTPKQAPPAARGSLDEELDLGEDSP